MNTLTNLANGFNSNDAVNLSQVNSLISTADASTKNYVDNKYKYSQTIGTSTYVYQPSIGAPQMKNKFDNHITHLKMVVNK